MQVMWRDLLQRHQAQVRFLMLVVLYSGGLTMSLWFAWQLRFDFAVPGVQAAMWMSIAWIVPLKLVLLWPHGSCRPVELFRDPGSVSPCLWRWRAGRSSYWWCAGWIPLVSSRPLAG